MKPVEIKIEIIRKGWTQKAVAKALGIHEMYVSQLCNGHRKSRRTETRIRLLPPFKQYQKSMKGVK